MLAALAISMFTVQSIHAQCEPDPNCTDTDEPGEICPAQLEDGTVGVPYEQVITVIPPGEATVGETTITIVYVTLDNVGNLPPGLTYSENATDMYADSAYCVAITGTPTTSGEYALAITITPWVSFGADPVPYEPVTNDTSVVMTINEASGLDPASYHQFQVIPNIPNPFSEVTQIGFYTPQDEWVELMVYNILGELMYQEKQGVPPGEHHFRFSGSALLPGTYFYRVTNQKEVITGKLVKARR